MVLFFFLFLVVRGTPALMLYRNVLDRRARIALARSARREPIRMADVASG
jgi:hypothetical protein